MEGGSLSEGGWMSKHRSLYEAATQHPFILGIKQGTVDLPSIKRCLEQDYIFVILAKKKKDYIFVREFVPFVASVLLKACKESDDVSDMEVILGGPASLAWFKKEATKWNVQLSDVQIQKANQDYCRWIKNSIRADGNLSEMGNDGFKQNCLSLQTIANRLLEKAHEDALDNAEAAFLCVLEKEVGFWNMNSCDASL